MEIIDKKTVWEGRFLRTLIISYKDRAGSVREWEAVERVNCDGIVVVVPVTEQKEFLLIRQFRPVLNGFVIEFPAGLNDKGESLINAARRELIEETGYTAEKFVYLTDGPVSSGMSTEILSVFLTLNAYPASNAVKEQYPADESESIEVIKTPLDKIYEILHARRKYGDHIDMKIYGLIELAKCRLKVNKG